MKNPETSNNSPHDVMLAELGIGPVWKLRDRAGDMQSVHFHAVADAVATPLSREKIDSAGSDTRMPTEELDWAALEARVSDCRACGLCEGRAKTVFGVGDQKAKWLFVGEGPGYNENLQGVPFVGPAGALLDNILRSLGMQRGTDTYIANVVKCRPTDAQGKDRAPASEEIAACLPYLKRQIALIQPEIIIALGKTAAISLLELDPETPVGKLRGSLHHYQNLPLVVTYHPAYLLRKPTEKSKTWEDLCLALNAIAPSPAKFAAV